MDSCGCTGSATPAGPVLSGNLDPSFGAQGSGAGSTSDESLLASVSGGEKPFSLAWFLEVGAVVVFLLGVAYVLDHTKKQHED